MPRSTGLVECGLGTERPSFLEVLLDVGFLVVQVELGAGAVGDDLGAEGPGGAELAALADGPAEDDVHLVRAADVQVVADQLLEEDPPGQRPVQATASSTPTRPASPSRPET